MLMDVESHFPRLCDCLDDGRKNWYSILPYPKVPRREKACDRVLKGMVY